MILLNDQVVNDGEMNLWRELGVNSWPTFALVGPNGKLLAQLAGEGHRKVSYGFPFSFVSCNSSVYTGII